MVPGNTEGLSELAPQSIGFGQPKRGQAQLLSRPVQSCLLAEHKVLEDPVGRVQAEITGSTCSWKRMFLPAHPDHSSRGGQERGLPGMPSHCWAGEGRGLHTTQVCARQTLTTCRALRKCPYHSPAKNGVLQHPNLSRSGWERVPQPTGMGGHCRAKLLERTAPAAG